MPSARRHRADKARRLWWRCGAGATAGSRRSSADPAQADGAIILKARGAKMKSLALRASTIVLGLLLLPVAAPADSEWMPDARANAAPVTVTRAQLYAVLDNCLAALKSQNPADVKWAKQVRNTENNVALMVGDGLWRTITALGTYDLRFADLQLGQVGFFGTVTETEETAA